MLLKPNPENRCFVCGGANDRGMQLAFERDDVARRIRGAFRVGAEYEGARGYVHGGIIATLLDEVMSKVSLFEQSHAVTAELSVEYLKPVLVGKDLILESWEVEKEGRNRFRRGEIRDDAGTILARGKGRFVEIRMPSVEHS
jgi:uncharacterized protein (TIGR00369 family)